MTGPYRTLLSDPPWAEFGGGKIKRGADKHYGLIKKKEDILRVMLESGKWNPADDGHYYQWTTNNFLEDGLWLMRELGFRYITNRCWGKKRFGIGRYFRGQHELCLFGVRGNGFSPDVRTPVNNITTFTETEETALDLYLRVIELVAGQCSLPGWKPEMDQPLLAYVETEVWPKLSAAEQTYVDGERLRAWEDVDGTYVLESHVLDEHGERKHSAKPRVFYEIIEQRSKGPYVEFFARSGREGWDSWGNEAPAVTEAAP